MKWTPEMDRKLMSSVKRGDTRRQTAAQLGVPRNAVIARYHRILGNVFESDRKRGILDRIERKKRAIHRAKLRARLEAEMRKALQRGVDRREAMIAAHEAGLPYKNIGQYFGFSHQAAQQYCNYK